MYSLKIIKISHSERMLYEGRATWKRYGMPGRRAPSPTTAPSLHAVDWGQSFWSRPFPVAQSLLKVVA